MYKLKFLLVVSTLLLFTLACAASPSADEAGGAPRNEQPADFTPPLTEAEVPRVSLEDAKSAFDNGTAVLVDVRSRDAFDASRIPGALHILLGEFETDPQGTGLPRDQWIITYCT